MKICYISRRFNRSTYALVNQMNPILDEYEKQGLTVTVRQLYYALVSRNIIPNNMKSYKRMANIVSEARIGGLIDWEIIEDITRYVRRASSWVTPKDMVADAAEQYKRPKWKAQKWAPEVWIEKDALVGVIEGVCSRLDVPFFSCRGYTSQSEMWSAAQRLGDYIRHDDQDVIIFHLGDHDPSGLDMSRDIGDRITRFIAQDSFNAGKCDVGDAYTYAGNHFRLERLALNMDQIEQYGPPPNPAKLTDSRGAGYVAEYGYESWELDALEPTVIGQLIEDAIFGIRDVDLWQEAAQEEERHRDALAVASSRWAEVVKFLDGDE